MRLMGQQTRGGRSMSTRLTIISQIEQVAEEQKIKLPPLTDELVLLDSGLDSLCFAILVARLEDTLGVDPFTASDDVYFPVTLGDFVKVYENAAKSLAVAP
jgi:acyl carrier protein